jgi:hypothetical protein
MKGSEQRNAHFPSLTTLSLMGRATRNRHLWKRGSDIFGMTPKENQRIDCVVLSTSVCTFLLMMVPKMRETRLKMSRFIHQKTPPPKKKQRVAYLYLQSRWHALAGWQSTNSICVVPKQKS